jgi:hypothetical protein
MLNQSIVDEAVPMLLETEKPFLILSVSISNIPATFTLGND